MLLRSVTNSSITIELQVLLNTLFASKVAYNLITILTCFAIFLTHLFTFTESWAFHKGIIILASLTDYNRIIIIGSSSYRLSFLI
jgi:hypothetical protein